LLAIHATLENWKKKKKTLILHIYFLSIY
jgi:hypothetical protein